MKPFGSLACCALVILFWAVPLRAEPPENPTAQADTLVASWTGDPFELKLQVDQIRYEKCAHLPNEHVNDAMGRCMDSFATDPIISAALAFAYFREGEQDAQRLDFYSTGFILLAAKGTPRIDEWTKTPSRLYFTPVVDSPRVEPRPGDPVTLKRTDKPVTLPLGTLDACQKSADGYLCHLKLPSAYQVRTKDLMHQNYRWQWEPIISWRSVFTLGWPVAWLLSHIQYPTRYEDGGTSDRLFELKAPNTQKFSYRVFFREL
jgi:hypothetical protein